MNVMHLQHLVSHGQWSDAVEYLSRFLPSDRPLGVHGRALLHFLRVHKAIDDIVAGARESLSVVAAVTMCSDRFVTSNPALTKLRAIFSSLIESKTPRYHHPNQLIQPHDIVSVIEPQTYIYCVVGIKAGIPSTW
jgi:hypothetical protein